MDIKAIFLGLAFAFMWSSAFTSGHIIVSSAPPILSLALRFLISGLLGVLLARYLGQNWELTRRQWIATFIFGVFQNALYLGLTFVAMQTIEASLAAIVASTMPLMVALLGWIIFKEKINGIGFLGLIAGLLGVLLIMGTRISSGVDLFGLTASVIGMFGLTFATLAVRGASSGGNLLMVVGLQMLVGSLTLFVVAFQIETVSVNYNWALLAAFCYTTLVPGLLATWVWFVLVDRVGAVRASTFHFLNPFFGIFIAAIMLGEVITFMDIIGVFVIAAGILAVQLARIDFK